MVDNEAVYRRFHDAANSGSVEVAWAAIDEVVAPDMMFHGATEGVGRDILKEIWASLLAAFPDIHVAVEDMIVVGDKVVCRNRVTGTHRGEYRGVAATGKSIVYNEIFIFRFSGGRIVEIWGVVDVFSQLRQLGVV